MEHAGTSEPVVVYGVTGCTSCLRVKEYLSRRGVLFSAADVATDPRHEEELAALGIRALPVVRQGSRHALGIDLKAVDELLDLPSAHADPLPGPELAARTLDILETAVRLGAQIPRERLAETLPGRDRTYLALVNHVVEIVEEFVDATRTGRFDVRATFVEGDEPARDIDAVGPWADDVRAAFGAWAIAIEPDALREVYETPFGPQTQHALLERTTWHAAQHTRQLMMVLTDLGIEPDRPLTDAHCAGLPMPAAVWG